MKKTLVAAALIAALSAPAFASDAPAQKTFKRDGETYIYTQSTEAGRTHLSGRSFPTGGRFNLVVQGTHVTGIASGHYVSFTVAEAAPTELASR